MYLERFRETWFQGASIVAVTVGQDGAVWASDGATIRSASGTLPIPNVQALAANEVGLWAGTETHILSLVNGEVRDSYLVGEPVLTFFGIGTQPFSGALPDALTHYALTATRLFHQTGEGWQEHPTPDAVFVGGTLDERGNIWLISSDTVYSLKGLEWTAHRPPGCSSSREWTSNAPPEALPERWELRTVAGDAHGHLWVGTSSGLLLFGGKSGWHLLRGAEGLPIEDITHLALGADLWVGTPEGVCLLTEDTWEYYAGLRWLPNNRVQGLAVSRRSAWVATPDGLSHLERRPFTLEAKAELFEAQVQERHNRNGYVTICFFEEPGNLATARHEVSDNDGLWTALYIAAESYRYAVTGSLQARERASRSMDALLRLEEATPIPGFPARALMRKDEEHVVQSRGEWHATADGASLWKGDTSSDEIDGHIYAFSVYHDLVADVAEKRRIAQTLHRIASHLLEHDYYLVDMDGQPTRWGVWAPARLNGDWKAQQGLNSLEILACLKTAFQLTDDSKFDDAYYDLIQSHHYALNTLEQKLTAPGWVNHSDDELAFLSYYPLLKYETDADLRRLYRLSLERSWRIERPERCPLWNFIYGALTGQPCDVVAAIRTLQEIPNDLISWEMRNSHRADVQARAEGWNQELDDRVLPYFERRVHKWNGNPFRLDGGDAGHSEEDGTVYLLPYWMGRYYGFIHAA